MALSKSFIPRTQYIIAAHLGDKTNITKFYKVNKFKDLIFNHKHPVKKQSTKKSCKFNNICILRSCNSECIFYYNKAIESIFHLKGTKNLYIFNNNYSIRSFTTYNLCNYKKNNNNNLCIDSTNLNLNKNKRSICHKDFGRNNKGQTNADRYADDVHKKSNKNISKKGENINENESNSGELTDKENFLKPIASESPEGTASSSDISCDFDLSGYLEQNKNKLPNDVLERKISFAELTGKLSSGTDKIDLQHSVVLNDSISAIKEKITKFTKENSDNKNSGNEVINIDSYLKSSDVPIDRSKVIDYYRKSTENKKKAYKGDTEEYFRNLIPIVANLGTSNSCTSYPENLNFKNEESNNGLNNDSTSDNNSLRNKNNLLSGQEQKNLNSNETSPTNFGINPPQITTSGDSNPVKKEQNNTSILSESNALNSKSNEMENSNENFSKTSKTEILDRPNNEYDNINENINSDSLNKSVSKSTLKENFTTKRHVKTNVKNFSTDVTVKQQCMEAVDIKSNHSLQNLKLFKDQTIEMIPEIQNCVSNKKLEKKEPSEFSAKHNSCTQSNFTESQEPGGNFCDDKSNKEIINETCDLKPVRDSCTLSSSVDNQELEGNFYDDKSRKKIINETCNIKCAVRDSCTLSNSIDTQEPDRISFHNESNKEVIKEICNSKPVSFKASGKVNSKMIELNKINRCDEKASNCNNYSVEDKKLNGNLYEKKCEYPTAVGSDLFKNQQKIINNVERMVSSKCEKLSDLQAVDKNLKKDNTVINKDCPGAVISDECGAEDENDMYILTPISEEKFDSLKDTEEQVFVLTKIPSSDIPDDSSMKTNFELKLNKTQVENIMMEKENDENDLPFKKLNNTKVKESDQLTKNVIVKNLSVDKTNFNVDKEFLKDSAKDCSETKSATDSNDARLLNCSVSQNIDTSKTATDLIKNNNLKEQHLLINGVSESDRESTSVVYKTDVKQILSDEMQNKSVDSVGVSDEIENCNLGEQTESLNIISKCPRKNTSSGSVVKPNLLDDVISNTKVETIKESDQIENHNLKEQIVSLNNISDCDGESISNDIHVKHVLSDKTVSNKIIDMLNRSDQIGISDLKGQNTSVNNIVENNKNNTSNSDLNVKDVLDNTILSKNTEKFKSTDKIKSNNLKGKSGLSKNNVSKKIKTITKVNTIRKNKTKNPITENKIKWNDYSEDENFNAKLIPAAKKIKSFVTKFRSITKHSCINKDVIIKKNESQYVDNKDNKKPIKSNATSKTDKNSKSLNLNFSNKLKTVKRKLCSSINQNDREESCCINQSNNCEDLNGLNVSVNYGNKNDDLGKNNKKEINMRNDPHKIPCKSNKRKSVNDYSESKSSCGEMKDVLSNMKDKSLNKNEDNIAKKSVNCSYISEEYNKLNSDLSELLIEVNDLTTKTNRNEILEDSNDNYSTFISPIFNCSKLTNKSHDSDTNDDLLVLPVSDNFSEKHKISEDTNDTFLLKNDRNVIRDTRSNSDVFGMKTEVEKYNNEHTSKDKNILLNFRSQNKDKLNSDSLVTSAPKNKIVSETINPPKEISCATLGKHLTEKYKIKPTETDLQATDEITSDSTSAALNLSKKTSFKVNESEKPTKLKSVDNLKTDNFDPQDSKRNKITNALRALEDALFKPTEVEDDEDFNIDFQHVKQISKKTDDYIKVMNKLSEKPVEKFRYANNITVNNGNDKNIVSTYKSCEISSNHVVIKKEEPNTVLEYFNERKGKEKTVFNSSSDMLNFPMNSKEIKLESNKESDKSSNNLSRIPKPIKEIKNLLTSDLNNNFNLYSTKEHDRIEKQNLMPSINEEKLGDKEIHKSVHGSQNVIRLLEEHMMASIDISSGHNQNDDASEIPLNNDKIIQALSTSELFKHKIFKDSSCDDSKKLGTKIPVMKTNVHSKINSDSNNSVTAKIDKVESESGYYNSNESNRKQKQLDLSVPLEQNIDHKRNDLAKKTLKRTNIPLIAVDEISHSVELNKNIELKNQDRIIKDSSKKKELTNYDEKSWKSKIKTNLLNENLIIYGKSLHKVDEIDIKYSDNIKNNDHKNDCFKDYINNQRLKDEIKYSKDNNKSENIKFTSNEINHDLIPEKENKTSKSENNIISPSTDINEKDEFHNYLKHTYGSNDVKSNHDKNIETNDVPLSNTSIDDHIITQNHSNVSKPEEYLDISNENVCKEKTHDSNDTSEITALIKLLSEHYTNQQADLSSITDELLVLGKRYKDTIKRGERNAKSDEKSEEDVWDIDSLITNCMIEAATGCVTHSLDIIDSKTRFKLMEEIFDDDKLIFDECCSSKKLSSGSKKNSVVSEGIFRHLKNPEENIQNQRKNDEIKVTKYLNNTEMNEKNDNDKKYDLSNKINNTLNKHQTKEGSKIISHKTEIDLKPSEISITHLKDTSLNDDKLSTLSEENSNLKVIPQDSIYKSSNAVLQNDENCCQKLVQRSYSTSSRTVNAKKTNKNYVENTSKQNETKTTDRKNEIKETQLQRQFCNQSGNKNLRQVENEKYNDPKQLIRMEVKRMRENLHFIKRLKHPSENDNLLPANNLSISDINSQIGKQVDSKDKISVEGNENYTKKLNGKDFHECSHPYVMYPLMVAQDKSCTGVGLSTDRISSCSVVANKSCRKFSSQSKDNKTLSKDLTSQQPKTKAQEDVIGKKTPISTENKLKENDRLNSKHIKTEPKTGRDVLKMFHNHLVKKLRLKVGKSELNKNEKEVPVVENLSKKVFDSNNKSKLMDMSQYGGPRSVQTKESGIKNEAEKVSLVRNDSKTVQTQNTIIHSKPVTNSLTPSKENLGGKKDKNPDQTKIVKKTDVPKENKNDTKKSVKTLHQIKKDHTEIKVANIQLQQLENSSYKPKIEVEKNEEKQTSSLSEKKIISKVENNTNSLSQSSIKTTYSDPSITLDKENTGNSPLNDLMKVTQTVSSNLSKTVLEDKDTVVSNVLSEICNDSNTNNQKTEQNNKNKDEKFPGSWTYFSYETDKIERKLEKNDAPLNASKSEISFRNVEFLRKDNETKDTLKNSKTEKSEKSDGGDSEPVIYSAQEIFDDSGHNLKNSKKFSQILVEVEQNSHLTRSVPQRIINLTDDSVSVDVRFKSEVSVEQIGKSDLENLGTTFTNEDINPTITKSSQKIISDYNSSGSNILADKRSEISAKSTGDIRQNESIPLNKVKSVKSKAIKILEPMNGTKERSKSLPFIKSTILDQGSNDKIGIFSKLNRLRESGDNRLDFSEYLQFFQGTNIDTFLTEVNFPFTNYMKLDAEYPKESFLIPPKHDDIFLKKIFTNLPSVSTVLNNSLPTASRSALSRWKTKITNEVGSKGFEKLREDNLHNDVQFHDCIQKHLLGTPLKELYEAASPNVKKSLQSLQTVLLALSHVTFLEAHVVHSLLPYHGIIDCIARYDNIPVLIEWKQADSRLSLLRHTYDAPVQLAAYLGAFNHDKKYKFSVSSGLIVVAYTDGSPADAFPLSSDDCLRYWRVWLSRLSSYFDSKKNN